MVVRQHDVSRNAGTALRGATPYLFVLQHDINSGVPTVIVAPISDLAANKIVSKLDIPITVQNRKLYIRVHQLAAIPRSQLRAVVENRNDLHVAITAAVNILFSGF